MRIALISASFLPSVGGLEWKVHFLATEYTARGHHVVVFTGRPKVSFRPILLPVTPTYAVVRCGFPIPGMGRWGLGMVFFRRAFLKAHQRAPFDVMHSHHLGFPTFCGAAIKAATGVPLVATATGDDVMVMPEFGYGDQLRPHRARLLRSNLQCADVVGSISIAIRTEIERIGTTATLVDIPNGVPWEQFQYKGPRVLRTQLGISEETVLVISVGRYHPAKAYDVGLRAFARVASSNLTCHYALIGRNTSRLSDQVAELGLTDRVSLIEQLPFGELPAIFHSADVFFNPSRSEGFAQVNAQALASGLPLVITDAPGNRDAGRYGGAIIARSDDHASMSAALEELLHHPQRRRDLAAQAYQASSHFAWSHIAEQYLNVFATLVSHRAAASTEIR